MTEEYPWFTVVDSDVNLLQGDFIKECPVVIPPIELSGEVEITIEQYDVTIMSQSCDLEQDKLDLVLVCPIWPLPVFEEKDSYYKSKEAKESLRRGYLPGYHLLNRCDLSGFEMDYLVVDFRNVYGVPFDFLKDFVKKRGKRLRLLPPYREHLSQAFARFFMRVGLPSDIPSFINIK